MNNGSSSDDIKFNSYANKIAYKPNRSGDYWIINNYNNPSPFYQETTNFVGEDGINGNGPALLKVHTEDPTEIESLITYIDIQRK